MNECPPVIVVGNKCDLEGAQRVVTKEEGKALSLELGQGEGVVSFAESSAKSNINVYEVFADVIRQSKGHRKNFLGTVEAYFVCHIGPYFQISSIFFLHWVSVVRECRDLRGKYIPYL